MFCNFCNKKFSNNYTLKTHKTTAKYCLKLQQSAENLNKEYEEEINKDDNKCYVCFKNFTNKSVLKRHLNTVCKISYEINEKINEKIKNTNANFYLKINELENKIKVLENENLILKSINNLLEKDHECLQDIAKQPKTINNNNNTTNNNNKILNMVSPLDFSDENNLKNIIENNYKLNYIFSGQKGIAQFAVEHLLKDEEGNLKYVCTDPSRNIFKYKDDNGDIKKDIEAKKLTTFLIKGGIKDKAYNMATDWWTNDNGNTDISKFELLSNKAEEMRIIEEDNSEFKKELVTMTTV